MLTKQLTTAEQLSKLRDDQRHELVKGELRTMPPAGFDHGAVSINLGWLLTTHVKEHALGIVVGAETGFQLANDPDTVRGADVAFVRAARIPPSGRPTGFWPGAPDLAVEVVSPGDTLQEIEDKVDEYLAAGAAAVWVVNPRRRTITIHLPGANPIILREGDTLDGGDVVPGFRCGVAEVFA